MHHRSRFICHSLPTLAVTAETTAVSVVINDAAGNVGEAIIYEKEAEEPAVTLEVDQAHVETRIGKEVKVTITEATTLEGKTTEKDVTKLATYKVADDKIATVEEGTVKGKGQGTTTITVTYGEHILTFDVTVVKPGNGK